MDPNTTLATIANLLRQAPGDDTVGLDLDLACQDLFDWMEVRGGFAPDWAKHESAAGYYQCRAVHHRRGERVVEAEYNA